MITKDIYKYREQGEHTMMQLYQYGLQNNALKYRKEPLHKFLRTVFLKGVPPIFQSNSMSASRDTQYIASDINGEMIYNLRKEVNSIPFPVTVYKNCTHFFSQVCLESNGFVEKKFRAEKGLTVTNAMQQHERVQKHFMYTNNAIAMEVPVWDIPKSCTAFLDLVVRFKGAYWILDYKPQADSAKNKHAVSQLLLGRDMLHKHTGIEFKCAYFDERTTYILNL